MPLAEPVLRRLRMSWEEYLALPERPRAEWVGGEVIVTPAVTFDHGSITMRLGHLLMTHLPGLHVVTEVGLQLSPDRVRGPDLMVTERRPAGKWVTEPPLLVAEVVSPSTRSEDTGPKSDEYAAGGVGHYWIGDPERHTIDVFRQAGGRWATRHLHLENQNTAADVPFDGYGTVPLDLSALLAS